MNPAKIEELRELRAMWEAAPDGSDEKGLLGFRLMDEAFEALPHFLGAASQGDEGLRAAWAEAEAALPEGWWIHALYAWSFDDMAYRAEAASPGRQVDMSHSASTKRHGTKRFVSGASEAAYGATPAAALRALAARLAALDREAGR